MKESRRQRALELLDRAAAALYREGAGEVYAFGSAVKAEGFDEHSDVDIAVKGIPPQKRHGIIRTIEDIFAEVPFDVVFIEDELRPEIREKIRKEGVLWKR